MNRPGTTRPLIPSMTRSMVRSRQSRLRAEQLLPGGVDSPVRAFAAVGGEAPFIERAEGPFLWDLDGNRYVDYFGSWGPMILGHAHPRVIAAVEKAARNGTSFGASTPLEAELSGRIISAMPSIEKLRFVSSGTEATMSAIRLARAATGRKGVVKFIGCYHGHSDGLLVKAGSGVATFGIPGSAGVPEEVTHWTLTLPYNDPQALDALFAERGADIACVIVEPIAGNMGCVLPAEGYLRAMREVTRRVGALLIFDEVITGFRVGFGGAQELFQIDPDLTCLGKIIGGGLPCAAFGGKRAIMDLLAPLGAVYQAGTLSGNPLAMAAGIATLDELARRRLEIYPALDARAGKLVEAVSSALRAAGVAVTANRAGSMFTWYFSGHPVTDFSSAQTADTAAFARFHRAMLDRGVWLPPSQFESAFLGAAHTDSELEFTLAAAQAAAQELRA